MGIEKTGLQLGQEIVAWARTGGSKNLLATRPVKINMAGLKLAPKLGSDVVKIDKKTFSELEKNLINEIKSCKVENARVIDKDGHFAQNLKFIGDKYSVRLDPQMIFEEGVIDTFKDATYIHNHPFNAPLSSNDIYQFALLDIKKMIACTSDGGYSFIERVLPLEKINRAEFQKAATRLQGEEIKQMKLLGKKRGISDTARMELLNKWRYEKISTFAKEFNLKFENNINSLNKKDNIDGNLFSVNPINRFIDKIIIKFHSICSSN